MHSFLRNKLQHRKNRVSVCVRSVAFVQTATLYATARESVVQRPAKFLTCLPSLRGKSLGSTAWLAASTLAASHPSGKGQNAIEKQPAFKIHSATLFIIMNCSPLLVGKMRTHRHRDHLCTREEQYRGDIMLWEIYVPTHVCVWVGRSGRETEIEARAHWERI
jgi:hypothetical protein